jgi:hypothetical protein
VIETHIRELTLPQSRCVVEVSPQLMVYRWTDAWWNCAPATGKSEAWPNQVAAKSNQFGRSRTSQYLICDWKPKHLSSRSPAVIGTFIAGPGSVVALVLRYYYI